MLIVRIALWGDGRSLARALVELAIWLLVLAVATRRLEGDLLGELRGYLRSPSRIDDTPESSDVPIKVAK